MTPSNSVLLQFGTPAAQRAANVLLVVAFAAPIALLLYMGSTEQLGPAFIAWGLGFSASPKVRLAAASRFRFGEPWVSTLMGAIVLPVSLVWAPREAWLALGFFAIGWGEWLDIKGQQHGVRSSWRLLSAALAIGALCVWLWLRLHPAH